MNRSRSPIRLVVFDWAGTTIDFGSRAPATAFANVFAAYGVEVTDEQARGPMGLNKREHLVAMLSDPEISARWKEIYGEAWTEANVDAMYQDFVQHQLKAIEQTSELVPGLLEVVDQLSARGIKLGGTTGYFRAAAEAVARRASEAGYTPAANVCADDVPQGRPAPWMIYRVMQELRIYPTPAVVKVGDTVADVEAGRNAGCWTVGVCDGSSIVGLSRADLLGLNAAERATRLEAAASLFREAGAHAVAMTMSDLPQVIESLESGELSADAAAVVSAP